MGRKKKWIQKAIKKQGILSRQLRIPEKENISVTFLRKIAKTPIGKTIRNPTKKGRE